SVSGTPACRAARRVLKRRHELPKRRYNLLNCRGPRPGVRIAARACMKSRPKAKRSDARRADDLERHRLTVLYDTMRRVAAMRDTSQILDLIVNSAMTLLAVEGAALRLRDGNELVLSARTESAAAITARARIAVGESLSGAVVLNGEPIVVADLIADTRH